MKPMPDEDDGDGFHRKCPWPYFGGKRHAAPHVWAALGDVDHYVEPFAGTLAVLLERPHPCNRAYYSETANDADGFVVNFWRAIAFAPEETAFHASWPVAEADKTARQIALLRWREDVMLDKLAGDAGWCDPQMAGWWAWAVCCQIGAFTGDGPWIADPESGRIVKQGRGPRLPGVRRNLPHLGDNGQGVNHAGCREPGVRRDLPHLGTDGQGVNHAGCREPGVRRNRPHLGSNGQGVNRPQLREPGVLDGMGEFHPIMMPKLLRWFAWLSARLRNVRILNGDWSRAVTTGAAHTLPVRQGGVCGYFLDPPYANETRSGNLYVHDDGDVAADVRRWCVANGDDPKNRIVLAGFDTEHTELEARGWTAVEWFNAGFLRGGMAQQKAGGSQQHRERLWLSPHCLRPSAEAPAQISFFDALEAAE